MFFFFSSRRRHTRYWRDWSSDVCSSDLIWNKDKLVQKKSKYYYEGCEGGKTGYTIQSKHSFVATATRNNKSLIAILLHDQKHTYWDDVVKLFDYGFNNYTRETLYTKNQILCNYKVTNNRSEERRVG